MNFELVSSASQSDWERVYTLDSSALPTQSNVWANTIVHSGRRVNRSRYYKFADGLEAVLPLFADRTSPRPISVYRSMPPAWGFGGVVSSAPLTPAHLKAILSDCTRLRVAAIQIRPNPLHADLWAQAVKGTGWRALKRNAHMLDLSGGFDEVWNHRFPSKTRTKIRKAEKAGVIIETGLNDNLIEEFDELFRHSIARWAHRQNEFHWLAALRGRLRDPKRKFLTMAHYSGDLLRISIARVNGTPVAGTFVLVGQNAHYTRGAMDADLIGQSNANYLLQKLMIKEACERSCLHYQMGESGDSKSLAQYKTGFGAVGVPYAEYLFEHIPVVSADRKLRALVKRTIGFRDV